MQRQTVGEWLPGAEGGRNEAWPPTGLRLPFERIKVPELETVMDTQRQDHPKERSDVPCHRASAVVCVSSIAIKLLLSPLVLT